MPGGDRTGPTGAGPMTGRGAGYCTGNPVPGCANAGFGGRDGFGRGMGRGGGRGRRNWFFATGLPGWFSTGQAAGYGPAYSGPVTDAQQLEALRSQAEFLEDSLGNIRRRIEELEKDSSK